METSRAGARAALLEAVKQIEEAGPNVNMEEVITLHAVTPHQHTFKSTVGREVRWALSVLSSLTI